MSMTATEAARNFSDLLNRVRYRRESIDIVRGGEVVARVVPPEDAGRGTVGDLLERFTALPSGDPGFSGDLEAIQASVSAAPTDPWGS
jgi:prevent-host-death family protein